MSKVNYLFDKLLFESTIMGEIKNLATFINDRQGLLDEFSKIMTALFDYKASGLLIMSEDNTALYLDLKEGMLSDENVKTVKDFYTNNIKIEIAGGMEYNNKKYIFRILQRAA